MRIVRHFNHCPSEAKQSVIALGNFDGVHKGHAVVISEALARANFLGVPASVMTFEPHPINVLKKDCSPFRLGSFWTKARQIETLGVDVLFTQHFDAAFSHVTAEEFIKDILVDKLAVKHVVIGHDFIFGHKRGGNADLLRTKAEEYGFGFTQVTSVAEESDICSSTKIRKYLQQGEVEKAAHMLGRSHSITGKVCYGDARGRTIGFPTANIRLKSLLRPKFGVYAVRVHIEGNDQSYCGVANIGERPTFERAEARLEVHLFDFDSELYGKRLTVGLLSFLRAEKKFDTISMLKEQIANDAAQAKELLVVEGI